MEDDAKNVGTFDLLAMRHMPDEDDPTVADFEFFGIKGERARIKNFGGSDQMIECRILEDAKEVKVQITFSESEDEDVDEGEEWCHTEWYEADEIQIFGTRQQIEEILRELGFFIPLHQYLT